MSTAISSDASTRRWMSRPELRASGFAPAGPEIDYGLRWGEQRNIRVSYAPREGQERGYLYAHDPSTDRYLLLAEHTSPREVDAAWRELTAISNSPDGYLVLAALDEPGASLPVDRAGDLLVHCLDREMDAYRAYFATSSEPSARFDAAQAVVVQRSTRLAAEDLLIDGARGATADGQPAVVVRYRLLGAPGWTGRIAGRDMDRAAAETRRVHDLAQRHGYTLQATSITQGHATVSASRVPELDFAATRAPVPAAAPALGL